MPLLLQQEEASTTHLGRLKTSNYFVNSHVYFWLKFTLKLKQGEQLVCFWETCMGLWWANNLTHRSCIKQLLLHWYCNENLSQQSMDTQALSLSTTVKTDTVAKTHAFPQIHLPFPFYLMGHSHHQHSIAGTLPPQVIES